MTKKVRNEFNAHRQKRPVQVETASGKRVVTQKGGDSWYKIKPSWRFCMMDDEHEKWSPTKNHLLEGKSLKALQNFESQTWDQILLQSNNKNHPELPEQFCDEAKKRLSEIKIYCDEFISLRFDGKTRLYGYVDAGAYYIIWFDLNHEIYPSNKKHT